MDTKLFTTRMFWNKKAFHRKTPSTRASVFQPDKLETEEVGSHKPAPQLCRDLFATTYTKISTRTAVFAPKKLGMEGGKAKTTIAFLEASLLKAIHDFNTWSTIGCTCCIYKPSLFCKRQGGAAESTNGVQSRLLEPPGNLMGCKKCNYH